MTAPADNPGRWMGGLSGALMSPAFVPISFALEPVSSRGDFGTISTLGLLGAPRRLRPGPARLRVPRPLDRIVARHLFERQFGGS